MSERDLSSTVQQLVGSVPLVNCKIGDMMVQCLLDSGSMVTTVSSTFFDKHMKDKVGELKDGSHFLTLRAANELTLPYQSYTRCGSGCSYCATERNTYTGR